MDMQDFWSFTCWFSWDLGSSLKCSQYNTSICITLVDVHLNWLNWFHFTILEGGLVIIDSLHDFSVTIPRCYKDVNSFFSCTAKLWNFLSIECFHLICDISGFKSRIKRHLLIVGSFWTDFLYTLVFLCLFFL